MKKTTPPGKTNWLRKRLQKGSAGNVVLMGVLALLVGTGAASVGGIVPDKDSTGTQEVTIVTPTPEYNKPNLQLETFGYVTIAPTPAVSPPTTTTTIGGKPLCAPDDDNGIQVTEACQCMDLTIICKGGKGTDATTGQPFSIPDGDAPEGYSAGQDPCGTAIAPSDGRYCVAKPVIYLYPQKPTLVDVTVSTSGSIVVSDPHYPQEGWQDVLAAPDGTLQYKNKTYSELFYESSVTDFDKPQRGITLAKKELPVKLAGILDQLGLVGREKQEFLEFWVPKLQALPAPYVYFSVLDTSAKADVDHVTINPKPDTQIAFIAYFKPVNSANNGTPLQLPATPKRKGFVSVEWGGTIDTKSK